MADIKQETIQTVDPMLSCIFDKAGNVIAGGRLVSTKPSLRELVTHTERYILSTLHRCAGSGATNADTWQLIACYLALFNVQLTIKDRIETTKSREKRYTFFMSHGSPRAMLSFKLPVEAAAGFFQLPDTFRLLLSRSFNENKHLLIYPESLDCASFNAGSVDEPPFGTAEAVTVRNHIAQLIK